MKAPRTFPITNTPIQQETQGEEDFEEVEARGVASITRKDNLRKSVIDLLSLCASPQAVTGNGDVAVANINSTTNGDNLKRNRAGQGARQGRGKRPKQPPPKMNANAAIKAAQLKGALISTNFGPAYKNWCCGRFVEKVDEDGHILAHEVTFEPDSRTVVKKGALIFEYPESDGTTMELAHYTNNKTINEVRFVGLRSGWGKRRYQDGAWVLGDVAEANNATMLSHANLAKISKRAAAAAGAAHRYMHSIWQLKCACFAQGHANKDALDLICFVFQEGS